jgi:hypothetical protein
VRRIACLLQRAEQPRLASIRGQRLAQLQLLWRQLELGHQIITV